MNWSTIDWRALERLRTAFLAGTAGTSDYWQSESDLASYDATFAQRIGWKWDYVLAELQRRGWSPAPGTLLDWGCGSGIADRAFLDAFGTSAVSELRLLDRSTLAMRFAEQRAAKKYAGLKVASGIGAPISDPAGSEANTTLLISHVLTELPPPQLDTLVDLAASATSVLWVEPGTYETSRALIAVRERLRTKLNLIAPCMHSTGCGLLAPTNGRHWCHHFASPPPGVFTDGDWARFANFTGVDLRDLPLSFLVLDRRPAPALPPGATRVIGHPRLYKPHALLLGCDATGVAEKRLTKRAHPQTWSALKKGDYDPLQVWRTDEDEIVEAKSL
jgi:ribosomal protein RSM22 (predicted rRNA methylase)